MRLIRGDKEADKQGHRRVGPTDPEGSDSVASQSENASAESREPGTSDTPNLADEDKETVISTEAGPVDDADAACRAMNESEEGARPESIDDLDESELRNQIKGLRAEIESLLGHVQECEGRATALTAERDVWVEKAKTANDRFLRARDDLDRFRKRTERDLEDRIIRGKADFILSLLEVLDNFDRALDAAQPNPTLQAFVKGVDMIRRQFVEALKREGVERIPSPVGHQMDPNLHDAVAAQEGGGVHGIVTDELRKGYVYKGTVLRPTRVRVIR